MPKHYNIRVYGSVQGMGFRAATRARAQKLGLAGFVRNEPEGRVYIEVEGAEDALKKLVQWSQRGPWFASVARVEVEEGTVQQFKGFVIQ